MYQAPLDGRYTTTSDLPSPSKSPVAAVGTVGDVRRNTSPIPDAPPSPVVPYKFPLAAWIREAIGRAPSVPVPVNACKTLTVPLGVILKIVPQPPLRHDENVVPPFRVIP